jgi:hypothetical protein
VAVGAGEPLFKDIPAPVRLRLTDSKLFGSAAVHVYEPA